MYTLAQNFSTYTDKKFFPGSSKQTSYNGQHFFHKPLLENYNIHVLGGNYEYDSEN